MVKTLIADYADDQGLLAYTPVQAESLLHYLKKVAISIGLYRSSDKTEFMCFNQDAAIFSLNSKPLKFVDQFIYLWNSISSTESNGNKCIIMVRVAFDRLSTIWKSDLSDEKNRNSYNL